MNGWNAWTRGGARLRPLATMVATIGALLAATATAFAIPTVSSLAPNVGPATGGTRVDVGGANFSTASGATCINFGSKSGTAVSCPRTFLCQVTAPSGNGAVSVTAVFNGTSTDVAVFRYAPAIAKLSPTGGTATGGTTVKIDGQGFTVGSRLVLGVLTPWTSFTFGGVPATNVVCASASSCQMTAPANAVGGGTVDVIAAGRPRGSARSGRHGACRAALTGRRAALTGRCRTSGCGQAPPRRRTY